MRRLIGGGTDGNEQLTAMVAVVLVVLLAVLGVTILRIGQLTWLHLFLGLLLLGPVAAKLASTGYRFARYYTRAPTYRRKGPPPPIMRSIAPMVVLSTLVVFGSGVVLLGDGPAARNRWLLVHKASFILWLGFTALHVLGHLNGLGRTLTRAGRSSLVADDGAVGRWITVAGALVGGLILALVLIPDFASWTVPTAAWHHEH
jgi:hypothetical protein